MKTKYQQTDSSALLSIFTMSISLALLPHHGCSTTPAGRGKWHNPHIILILQNRNAQSTYGHSHFPGPENTKNIIVSIFIRYILIQCLPGATRMLNTSKKLELIEYIPRMPWQYHP